jgi:hypothetical protein
MINPYFRCKYVLTQNQVYQPEGTTTYSTFIDSTDSAYTSTISASATNSGTVIGEFDVGENVKFCANKDKWASRARAI